MKIFFLIKIRSPPIKVNPYKKTICNPYQKKPSILTPISWKPDNIGSIKNPIPIESGSRSSNAARSPYIPLSKVMKNPYLPRKLSNKPLYNANRDTSIRQVNHPTTIKSISNSNISFNATMPPDMVLVPKKIYLLRKKNCYVGSSHS